MPKSSYWHDLDIWNSWSMKKSEPQTAQSPSWEAKGFFFFFFSLTSTKAPWSSETNPRRVTISCAKTVFLWDTIDVNCFQYLIFSSMIFRCKQLCTPHICLFNQSPKHLSHSPAKISAPKPRSPARSRSRARCRGSSPRHSVAQGRAPSSVKLKAHIAPEVEKKQRSKHLSTF